MSEKEYDPQYETKVPHFNKDIACEWVRNNENDRIKHWLENGRPHKRIVTEALSKNIVKPLPSGGEYKNKKNATFVNGCVRYKFDF